MIEPSEFSISVPNKDDGSTQQISDDSSFSEYATPLRSDGDGGSAAFSLASSRMSDEQSAPSPDRYSMRSINTKGSSEFIQLTKSEELKSSKVIQELTINKLRYDSVGLVGRGPETDILKNCLSRTMADGEESKKRKELIFIKGESGSGKSVLASTLRKQVSATTTRGIYVEGKFDFNNRDEPYSGISTAFGNICQTINQQYYYTLSEEKRQEVDKNIGEAIKSALGQEEVLLLSRLIPELDLILPGSALGNRESHHAASEGHDDFEAGKKRWEYAFRVLARILSSYYSPMVVVLDDLQWADVSSLEVIDFLISDVENSSPMMIVGCFRSNEVNDDHILSLGMQRLKEKCSKMKFNVTDLEIGNLQLDEVNHVVMALLGLDDKARTKGLAEVCLKRTLGNPFFLIEFVTMLEDEGLITFNLGTLDWVWDENAIEDQTMSTANVVDLLQSRMRKLSPDAQLLLQYAACLGSSFAVKTLSLVWEKKQADGKEEDPNVLLVQLTNGNFIERCGDNAYRWVHDRVQEAALTIGGAVDSSFRFEIGSVLYHSLSKDELEAILFEVTDLINAAGASSRRIEYAELNLRAAEKAQSMSAFDSSSVYVSKGIAFLPNEKWVSHYDLSLRFCNIGTQMNLALGRMEAMEFYSKEVLSQSEIPTMDKGPVLLAQCDKLSNFDKDFSKAVSFCLEALKEFGIKMFRSRALVPVNAIASLLGTMRRAKKTPEKVYKALEAVSDPRINVIMKLLRRLSYASHMGQDLFMQTLATTQMIKLTMEHGVGEVSGSAFATLGLLTVALQGDVPTGTSFVRTALSLQEKAISNFDEAATKVLSSMVLPWTEPYQTCSPLVFDGYSAGMRSGNSEMAMWCRFWHDIHTPFHMGKRLGPIEAKCGIALIQSKELKQEIPATRTTLYWQFILNMMGRSEDTTVVSGDAFDPAEMDFDTDANGAAWKALLKHLTIMLQVYFGKFEEAADLSIALGNGVEKTFPADSGMIPLDSFFRGLAFYGRARIGNKRRYTRLGNSIRNRLKKWIKDGNPNISQYYSLLSAEQAVLDKDYKLAHEMYREAITLSARTGFIPHAALANERYANFFLNVLVDEDKASYRMEEAVRYYSEWGADAKVEALMKSPDLW